MNNQNALVMCLAEPSNNPRPNRIIQLLAREGYTVDILSHPSKDNLPVHRRYTIPRREESHCSKYIRCLLTVAIAISLATKIGRIDKVIAIFLSDLKFKLFRSEKSLYGKNYDLIVVEDLQLLPLAFRLRGIAKILFDAREFYTKQNEESLKFRLFEKPFRDMLCKKYLGLCDHLITVSPGLATAYKNEFGVDMTVIRSTPSYRVISVEPCAENEIRMVYHGGANMNRGLRNMIEVVSRLDSRFTLDFYLVGSSQNIVKLEQEASGCPRIYFREPVPFEEIVPMLSVYDIGFYYLEPNGFNVTYNLPNKLFEFIQARLSIAIGPSPDMADLVNKYRCGFVAKEFSIEAMVNTLESLNSDLIDKAKLNSDIAAKELCYENESRRLLGLLR